MSFVEFGLFCFYQPLEPVKDYLERRYGVLDLPVAPGEIPQSGKKPIFDCRWADEGLPVVKSVLPVCCVSLRGITTEFLGPIGFETAEKSSNN
mgnify:CR=1 FL=1